MTYFATSIRNFLFSRPKAISSDPVYHFFIETSSRERKKVYNRALKKVQKDQEEISLKATRKIRA